MLPEIQREKTEDLLFHETKPILELRLEYPQVTGMVSKHFEERFNCYYLKKVSANNAYARTVLYKKASVAYRNSLKNGFPFNAAVFEQSYFNTFNNGKLISLYFDTYTYEKGPHGTTRRTAETWSVATGEILPLCSFFRRGFDYNRFIRNNVSGQITCEMNKEESIYYKNAPERCKRIFKDTRYYLSDSGFIFYYPSYSLAPYCAGIRTFEIPFEAFEKNLKQLPHAGA